MICQDFLPSPPLRDFVRCYHLRHFVFEETSNVPFKPYAPRPEQTLAFYPRGYEQVEYVASKRIVQRPRSILIGQYIERTNRHLSGRDFCTFLIDFQPGVLHRLTGIPFYELTNSFIDAEAVFSKEIRLVNERLNSTADYAEMIAIVETFLLEVVRTIKPDRHPIDTITNRLIERPEDTSIIQLAESSFLSPRQFERRFKQRMGIGPKLLARIARLTKAFGIKYNHPDLDWLSVALLVGYHDYQHLAKDFRDLAGATPTAYFQEDTKAPERHFGLLDSSL
jgi:AraC-like DNA-binding protein